MKYKIIVDCGIPYEIKVDSEEQLKKELEALRHKYETEDYPQFDVMVLNMFDEDITETQFIKDMIKETEKNIRIGICETCHKVKLVNRESICFECFN